MAFDPLGSGQGERQGGAGSEVALPEAALPVRRAFSRIP
jgi:hypothetical protein